MTRPVNVGCEGIGERSMNASSLLVRVKQSLHLRAQCGIAATRAIDECGPVFRRPLERGVKDLLHAGPLVSAHGVLQCNAQFPGAFTQGKMPVYRLGRACGIS